MDTPLFAFGQPHRPIPATVQARLQTKQRMPLMLPPEAVDPWLTGTPEEASSLLVRYPCALMRAHRVSKRVNKPENDDPELLTLVEA